MSTRRNVQRRCGATLIELIMFIVIIGAAVAGVLGAINYATRASVDPMIQKQALAIAEALLEEVQLQPFTYCDPDDANAATATRALLDSAVTPPEIGCTAQVEVLGPETEIRVSDTAPYDNVNDYQATAGGLALGTISDLTGATIAGLESYTATIAVAPQSLGGINATDDDGALQSLLITVTVAGLSNATVTLHGYRVRYAPNALP